MRQENEKEAVQAGFRDLESCSKIVDGRRLRFGYTTGSCAAAAAKAAAQMLFAKTQLAHVKLATPKGIVLYLDVLDITRGENFVSCAIKKDAGDDPDATDGVWVYARVSKRDGENFESDKNESFRRTETVRNEAGDGLIRILGGRGVGIVTRPGLDQPPGTPAINRVPRQMIVGELEQICQEYKYSAGLDVEISVPQGEELAERTFNPRLGIQGGISILGTTGIVEPMSESALISSIRLEMKQQAALGRKSLAAVPGNYGQQFLEENFPLELQKAIKCSNFVGETIDFALEFGIENLLFVAHIGKFIKVAGGIFQTHSRNADARMEILTANAVLAGAKRPVLTKLMEAVTTEEGIRILEESGDLERTMESVMERIEGHLLRRGFGRVNLGAIVFFSELGRRRSKSGELGRTANAGRIIEKICNEQGGKT